MGTLEEDSDAIQEQIRAKMYVGVGNGRNREEAKEQAFDNAWERAKADGKAGKWLRVQAEYVAGENPITWYRVILSDDN